MPDPEIPNPAPSIDLKDYNTVMAHFYRGEVGRIMVWRQRLDTTTNWAIVSTTGIVTYALGHSDISHIVFLFANVLCLLLLSIEARRYRFYDAFRARVRMLEAHFLVPVVMRNATLLQGDWQKLLAEDLLIPSLKMNKRDAMSRRLMRNYAWIFLILLGGWIAKIWLHYPESHGFRAFFLAARDNQPLPALVFWGMTGVFYAVIGWLLSIGLRSSRYSGEFQRKTLRGQKWLD